MSLFKSALDFLSGKTEEQLRKNEEKIRQLEIEKENINLNLAETELDLKSAQLQLESVTKCKNRIIYNANNQSVTVINCYGDTFDGYVESSVLEQLKQADTAEIIRLLTPEVVQEQVIHDVEQEEKEIVKPFLSIFENIDDFEVIGDNLYFVGVKSVAIPSLITARFIEILTKMNKYSNWENDIENQGLYKEFNEEYQSLKAFTLKLLLNPMQESREHALDFVRNFDIKMTNTGNLIMYRRIVARGNRNKNLTEFISKQYLKVKSWKKSPSKYKVVTIPDSNNYELKPFEFNVENTDYVCLGDLNFMYNNLSNLPENTYTDDYTKSYDIRIGATYKIREEDIDLNKNGSCGGALHVADGKKFSYSSFGNTPVVCIVNPQHIYKMDSGCSGKIGVRQMFIAAITAQDEEGNYEDIDSQDLVNFDELYHNESLEELQQALQTKSLEVTSVSTAMSDVSLKDVEVISNLLKSRIITI